LEHLPLGLSQDSQAVEHRHYYAMDGFRKPLNRKSSALDFGEVEQIRDENLHPIDSALNRIRELAESIRVHSVDLAKQVRYQPNRHDRIFEIVRNNRKDVFARLDRALSLTKEPRVLN
jgi:hypothetical protein